MENNTKPNWEQWTPVYGFYMALKDLRDGKPSIDCDITNHQLRYFGSGIYHALTSGIIISGALIGLEKLLR